MGISDYHDYHDGKVVDGRVINNMEAWSKGRD